MNHKVENGVSLLSLLFNYNVVRIPQIHGWIVTNRILSCKVGLLYAELLSCYNHDLSIEFPLFPCDTHKSINSKHKRIGKQREKSSTEVSNHIV